jgi:NCS1 family nucleobase:cation symporter-1
VAGIALTVHEIAGSLDPDSVAAASVKVYKSGFLLSFCMDAMVYYVLCLISSGQCRSYSRAWKTFGFEELADTEGLFDHEGISIITGMIERGDADRIRT